jgi:molybdopterin-guanine dinucleotide biosynthesis protein B
MTHPGAPRVLGLVGWSGAGKTGLIVALIPRLVERGLRLATIKHAHHAFDIDTPGKDSYEHRRAGAGEVIVASDRRWALMHEVADGEPAGLAALLRRLSPCDLVLVVSFKAEPFPKLEVYRAALGKASLHPHDPWIVGVISDQPVTGAGVPVAPLQDLEAVLALVLASAQPLASVLTRLDAAP